MLYVIPDYYKEFKCVADKCEDTCCAGWQIVIDEKSLRKYKKVCGEAILPREKKKVPCEPSFALRMLGSVDWKDGTFRQAEEKRCTFLNDENLCDLYTNLGEKSLCKTCRLYPRHIEEFEGLREVSLSISCPEVARILMERMEPVTFLSYEKEGEEEFEDFDPFLFSILEDARRVMIEILQNRKLSIQERGILVLGMAHDMQVRINRQEMFDCTSVIEKAGTEKSLRQVQAYMGKHESSKKFSLVKNLFLKLYELELLRKEWDVLLQETEVLLYGRDEEYYAKISQEFATWKKEHAKVDIHMEQLLVYFLFTYFPGAVYDGEVYAKAQMSVYCVWMIEELWKARWMLNGKNLSIEEMTELVYRFSREVEHSDVNLKIVESFMEKKWFLC